MEAELSIVRTWDGPGQPQCEGGGRGGGAAQHPAGRLHLRDSATSAFQSPQATPLPRPPAGPVSGTTGGRKPLKWL